MSAAIASQICGLGKAIIVTGCFFRTISLLFMLFCYWNCFFAKDSILLNFCHICASAKLPRVAFLYFVIGFNLFLYKSQIFYCNSFIFCDVCILNAHKKPICCHSQSICRCGKLGSILDSCFMQFIKCNILIIWAFK